MSRNSSRLNVTAVLGVIGVVVAALLMGAVIVASQPSTQVIYVPKADIPAFRTLSVESDLEQRQVTEDEIFADMLTKQSLSELTEDGTRPLYTVTNLQASAPIQLAQVSTDARLALQIVSDDEQLIGVTTSSAGSIAGTLRPGDVVDIHLDGAGQQADFSFQPEDLTYAKVIGFGRLEDAGRGVAGVENPVGGSDDSEIQVILAVAQPAASAVAGQEVSLSKRPYCTVADTGRISPVDDSKADACAVPSDRRAASAE